MVGHVDDRLIGTTDKVSLVLDPQHRRLLPIHFLRSRRIYNLRLHGPGEALIAILACQCELNALAALQPVDAGYRAHADGRRPVPDALAPAHNAAVEVVLAIVGRECVRLAAIEVPKRRISEAVGNASDRLAEIGVIVGDVEVLGWETLNYVGAINKEGLDYSAEGEEAERCIGHGGDR